MEGGRTLMVELSGWGVKGSLSVSWLVKIYNIHVSFIYYNIYISGWDYFHHHIINIYKYPIFIYYQYLSIFIINIPCLSIFINMPYKLFFFRLTMFWNLSGSDFRQEVRSILADIGLSPQNREEKFEARKPGRTTAGAHGALGPRCWDLGDHEQLKRTIQAEMCFCCLFRNWLYNIKEIKRKKVT